MSNQSNSNAILIDGCNPLRNLGVLLKVTEDLATTNSGGWSLQLNCYPPAGEYCQTSQLTWIQYIVYVQGGSLEYEVQYWANNSSNWPSNYTPQPNTTPWLPCWANDYYLSTPFASITGDTLPRESELLIQLSTDANGGVTKATFSYTDPDDNASSVDFSPPAVHPIVAFEVNLVGAGGGANANFTSGLTSSRGILYYSVTSGALSVQSGGPGAACGESGFFTAETSNAVYSDVAGAPGSTVTQTLGQPVDCAVNSLFADNANTVGQMRQIRDEAVAPTAAGQWISELLRRHSAEVVAALAGREDLQVESRALLRKAARIAVTGATFDDETIDRAKNLVAKAAPRSMGVQAAALATVLENLRGTTLADGLATASQTIRPRTAPRKPCASCDDRVTSLEAEVRKLKGQFEGD
jgi:hypothetical protein